MPENTPEQEPSIEEILASIRQIISDDDEEGGESPIDTSVDEVEEIDEPEDDVLELTEMIQEEEPEEVEDLPQMPEEYEIDMQDIETDEPEEVYEPEPEPEPYVPAPQPSVASSSSDILSDATKAAALSSISKLAGTMPIGRSPSFDGVTLEDIVRELLHPMLKEWMDDNLNDMVERLVQKELEKLARRAMDN